MNHEHHLLGCTPTPLAAYLKALAVLRLVAEQAGDPNATGCWRNDAFVLRTQLSRNELLEFFLERYAPTPLVAPWNGGSGFYPKDNQQGIRALKRSNGARFERYRQVIEACRSAVIESGLSESPKGDGKRAFLEAMRSRADEELLRWMDAAVILSGEGPRYPPLLGTGGNDGRLDFTNNFMQRLGDVMDIAGAAAKPEGRELLQAALFDVPTSSLSSRAIGQFSPGSAGGPNASSGFEGDARVNAWDFVLMLEGAVLLAASAVRRLESSSAAALSAPFTVRSRAGTVGGADMNDDSDARDEIWMPLWKRPFTLEEINALFSEGRAALGTRPAQDGLDFARAVARLGVDRGLIAFQRYGFLMRSGKAFLATPMSRVPVRRNPQADLIDELDRRDWLSRVQRYARDKDAPNAFRASAVQLDAALFALTQRTDRQAVERVLRLLGQIEASAARSPKLCEKIAPVSGLSPSWARRLDDGSAELRIAAALAGLSLRGDREGRAVYLGLRPHLAPVTMDGSEWDENNHMVCWGPGTLERNLAKLLHRRRLEAIRLNAEGDLLRSGTGATLDDLRHFLDRNTDDRRITELTMGLACADLRVLDEPKNKDPIARPTAYILLKPFFTAESVLRALDWLPPDRTLRLPAEIPARLAADDVTAALRIAWQSLRALGIKLPGREPPQAAGIAGPRLLAALMIPLTYRETGRLLRRLALNPELEDAADPKSIAETTD